MNSYTHLRSKLESCVKLRNREPSKGLQTGRKPETPKKIGRKSNRNAEPSRARHKGSYKAWKIIDGKRPPHTCKLTSNDILERILERS